MFAGSAALLQLRLLEVYMALPSPALYAGELEALTKLCMRTLRQAGKRPGQAALAWGLDLP